MFGKIKDIFLKYGKLRLFLTGFVFLLGFYFLYTQFDFFPNEILVNSNTEKIEWEVMREADYPVINLKFENIKKFERQFLSHRFNLINIVRKGSTVEQTWQAENLSLSLPLNSNIIISVPEEIDPLELKLFFDSKELLFYDQFENKFFFYNDANSETTDDITLKLTKFHQAQDIEAEIINELNLDFFSIDFDPDNYQDELYLKNIPAYQSIPSKHYDYLYYSFNEEEKQILQSATTPNYTLKKTWDSGTIKSQLEKWSELDQEYFFENYLKVKDDKVILKPTLTQEQFHNVWFYLNTVEGKIIFDLIIDPTEKKQLLKNLMENYLTFSPMLPLKICVDTMNSFLESNTISHQNERLLNRVYSLENSHYSLLPVLRKDDRKKIWMLFNIPRKIKISDVKKINQKLEDSYGIETFFSIYEEVFHVPEDSDYQFEFPLNLTQKEIKEIIFEKVIQSNINSSKFNELKNLLSDDDDELDFFVYLYELNENYLKTLSEDIIPSHLTVRDYLDYQDKFSQNDFDLIVFTSSYELNTDLPKVITREDFNKVIVNRVKELEKNDSYLIASPENCTEDKMIPPVLSSNQYFSLLQNYSQNEDCLRALIKSYKVDKTLPNVILSQDFDNIILKNLIFLKQYSEKLSPHQPLEYIPPNKNDESAVNIPSVLSASQFLAYYQILIDNKKDLDFFINSYRLDNQLPKIISLQDFENKIVKNLDFLNRSRHTFLDNQNLVSDEIIQEQLYLDLILRAYYRSQDHLILNDNLTSEERINLKDILKRIGFFAQYRLDESLSSEDEVKLSNFFIGQRHTMSETPVINEKPLQIAQEQKYLDLILSNYRRVQNHFVLSDEINDDDKKTLQRIFSKIGFTDRYLLRENIPETDKKILISCFYAQVRDDNENSQPLPDKEYEYLDFLLSQYRLIGNFLFLREDITNVERQQLKDIFVKINLFDSFKIRDNLSQTHSDEIFRIFFELGYFDDYIMYNLQENLKDEDFKKIFNIFHRRDYFDDYVEYTLGKKLSDFDLLYLFQLFNQVGVKPPILTPENYNSFSFTIQENLSTEDVSSLVKILRHLGLNNAFDVSYIINFPLNEKQKALLDDFLYLGRLNTIPIFNIEPDFEYLYLKLIEGVDSKKADILINDHKLSLHSKIDNSFIFSLADLLPEKDYLPVYDFTLNIKGLNEIHKKINEINLPLKDLHLTNFNIYSTFIEEEWTVSGLHKLDFTDIDKLTLTITEDRYRNDLKYHFDFIGPKMLHETYLDSDRIQIMAKFNNYSLDFDSVKYHRFYYSVPNDIQRLNSLAIVIRTPIRNIKVNRYDLTRLRPNIVQATVQQKLVPENIEIVESISFIRSYQTPKLMNIIQDSVLPVKQFYTWQGIIEIESLNLFKNLHLYKIPIMEIPAKNIDSYFEIFNADLTSRHSDNKLTLHSAEESVLMVSNQALYSTINKLFTPVMYYLYLALSVLSLIFYLLIYLPLSKIVPLIENCYHLVINYFKELKRVNLILKLFVTAFIFFILMAGVKKSNIIEPYYLTIEYQDLSNNANITLYYDMGQGFTKDQSISLRAPQTTVARNVEFTLPVSRFQKMKIEIDKTEFNLRSISITRNPYFNLMNWNNKNFTSNFNTNVFGTNTNLLEESIMLTSDKNIQFESNFTIESRVRRLYFYSAIFAFFVSFIFFLFLDIFIDILRRIEKKILKSHKNITGKDVVSYLFLYSLILLVLQSTEFAWKNLLIIGFIGLTVLIFLFFTRKAIVNFLKKIIIFRIIRKIVVFFYRLLVIRLFRLFKAIFTGIKDMNASKFEKMIVRYSNQILSVLFILLAVFLSLLYSYNRVYVIIIVLSTLAIIFLLNRTIIMSNLAKVFKFVIKIKLNKTNVKKLNHRGGKDMLSLSEFMNEKNIINIIVGLTTIILLFFIPSQPALAISFIVICFIILTYNNKEQLFLDKSKQENKNKED